MAPILTSNPTLTLVPEPLTPTNFAPYGTAIQSPLPRDLSIAVQPSSLPPHNPAPVLANQNSALKYSPISPMLDTYKNGPSGQPSATRMTMFCCFPRKLRTIGSGTSEKEAFDVRILERHPYTNQTFIPTDLSSHSKVGNGDEEPIFLVVVAPTLEGETATAKNEAGETITIRDPPDLRNVKAFIARGGQSVTYGVGTWHAPMVVLGPRRVDFVVVQHINGVDDEDCQEAAFGEGVVVDLGRRGQYGRKEQGSAKLWTAKL
ncbi:Ureidoglycolate hydrolase [Penicillium argentinense]|uniref:Ureidoglycolate hydrolase n=1 Tax=Penicillium argentinense TaxID=1131581 RepID=A0A9W9EPR2_9EURO|nr:Ureidoglycolate hydrolase [Penicillium argentinense]KAJ5085701.1 Ureidoglycolate hydrolase [Penicillium argentinense]